MKIVIEITKKHLIILSSILFLWVVVLAIPSTDANPFAWHRAEHIQNGTFGASLGGGTFTFPNNLTLNGDIRHTPSGARMIESGDNWILSLTDVRIQNPYTVTNVGSIYMASSYQPNSPTSVTTKRYVDIRARTLTYGCFANACIHCRDGSTRSENMIVCDNPIARVVSTLDTPQSRYVMNTATNRKAICLALGGDSSHTYVERTDPSQHSYEYDINTHTWVSRNWQTAFIDSISCTLPLPQ